jgi:hypothetical protein
MRISESIAMTVGTDSRVLYNIPAALGELPIVNLKPKTSNPTAIDVKTTKFTVEVEVEVEESSEEAVLL